jgi:hypothetical protein
MSDRLAGLMYGVLASSAVALILLIVDYPSDRNLIFAIAAGLIVGIGSFLHLRTR